MYLKQSSSTWNGFEQFFHLFELKKARKEARKYTNIFHQDFQQTSSTKTSQKSSRICVNYFGIFQKIISLTEV
jgi:hypothetical protein